MTTTECISTSQQPINEIPNFVDGRFICPHEATWRIFDFPIHCRDPQVQVLSVHLENMQNVSFRESTQLQNIIQNPFQKQTTLTGWLESNKIDERGRHLRYVDYVSEYRWDLSGKCWLHRSYNKKPSIGRLIYVHPSSGETFYLRMMLGHQRGCQNFVDIRTINGEIFPTYRSACEKLGLLQNDDEWVTAYNEASSWATSKELRCLFIHMLLYCEISNPLTMWQQNWRSMGDDISIMLEHNLGFKPSNITDEDKQQYILFKLEMILNSNTNPSSLSKFDLPMPRPDLLNILANRLLMEEKNYDTQQLASEHELLKNSLNIQQLFIYNLVVTSSIENKQILLFVYSHGGTGKTFLWKTITYALRATNKVVLTVAASGIASLLLPAGRTTHSRFKIPLDISDESICDVKKNTQLGQLLKETVIVIWDEAPMSDRRCFEALDKTLRDLLANPLIPFGGKSIILGGDFRQTLGNPIFSVKKKASKNEVINSSLPRSYLWSHFKLVKLTENMRLKRPNLTEKQLQDTAWFSSWLLDLGDGKLGNPIQNIESDTKQITIPSQFLLPPEAQNLSTLITYIYDDDTLKNPSIDKFSDKVIVCPKNRTADEINNIILNMSEHPATTYSSFDSVLPDANSPIETELLYPIEYLNGLNFNGLPPHALTLKVNTPIILLRNIKQADGLCYIMGPEASLLSNQMITHNQ
ncbi:uncharacterized protein LOC143602871 [Bidens hawaiensis]|uniref:uncharacterized protein LOC143602871 n=1 Tax=Bidens hawaiensis TaxID=980011 RepID=UPI00404B2308